MVLRWLALPSVPALVVSPPADHLAEIRQARESNEASETVVPTTFVDDAELVWSLTEKFTQEETAKAMGWSRPQVSQYAMLNKIDSEAWAVIATSFKELVATAENDAVAEVATAVATPFTENLLRNILDLGAGQQKRLCELLAKGAVLITARSPREGCQSGGGPNGWPRNKPAGEQGGGGQGRAALMWAMIAA